MNIWDDGKMPYYNSKNEFIPYLTPYIINGTVGAVLMAEDIRGERSMRAS